MERILLIIACCVITFSVRAQNHDAEIHKALRMPKDSLPYRLNPVLPTFSIRLTDSATIFSTKELTKGRPTVLMLFNPDCPHCKDMTERLLKGMDSLKNIQFLMVSNAHNVADIRNFCDKYQLANYKNIAAVGQDFDFFYITYYGARYVPDFALYDKNGKLVKLFESSVTVKELYDATH